MSMPSEIIAELNVLRLFDTSTSQAGLKVHSDADPELIAATKRLHEKQLITLPDGGYLTPLGYESSVHLQNLLQILTSKPLL
jgi:uncharacterized protein (TIGR02647 family)